MKELLISTATEVSMYVDKSACAMLHALHEMCRSSPAVGMMSTVGYFYPDTTLYRGLDVAARLLSIASPHGPMISEAGAKGSVLVLPHRAF